MKNCKHKINTPCSDCSECEKIDSTIVVLESVCTIEKTVLKCDDCGKEIEKHKIET